MIVVRGRPPFYWGIERDARIGNPRLIDGAWMVEALPPWRKSTRAVRIRIPGDRALHLGLCRIMDPDDPLRGSEELDATVTDISKWRRPGVTVRPAEKEDTSPGAGT